MKTFICLLILASLPSYGQVRNACVEVPLTLTDNAGGNTILIVGLDPTATDGIDPHWGEAELPPAPPSGVFDARLIGVLLGQGTLKNIRPGQCADVPYTKMDTIQYQVGSGTTITICWSLPNWVTWRLQDIIFGTIIDVPMLGNGCYTVTNPTAFSRLKLTARYPLIMQPPSVPTLLSPANGSTNQPTTLMLNWNTANGADTYHLQVATNPSFTPPLTRNDSDLTTTSQQIGPLANATTYYWQVRAKNIAGVSGWSSPTWNFRTSVALPNQVSLVSPANNAVIGADSAKLIWRFGQPEANRYWVEWGTDSTFTATNRDSSLTDTTRTIRSLANNQNYWWRVKARNAAGWGLSWSEQRKFKITVTDVQIGDQLPPQFVLNQNYPNPFNPTTTIEFALPKSSRATLKVFDVLGREVATLVDENLPAGVHRAEWNAHLRPSGFGGQAGGISSGVYLYRLQAGDFVETKKLLLLR